MTDPKTLWSSVDDWVEQHFLPADPALEQALSDSAAAGLPSIQVTAAQGRLLELLVRLRGARRVLEIGTLGGYSTTWLARGLESGGQVVTLEIDPHHAEVAAANLSAAGVSDRVEIIVGSAKESLARLSDPFDVVFIDADKSSTAAYFAAALRLSHPGTLIVVDNVVRGGAVLDASAGNPDVEGIRRFAELVAGQAGIRATAIQTVGSKGHDGFALIVVGD